MPNGYWGRILRVDLGTGKITVEEHDDKFYRTYFGGRGIIAYYLLNELDRNCDPLGPDNLLIFAASVLTGTAIPGAARNSVGAKSPLTGAFGESEGGGFWGVKLRWAGYDAVVISGRSEKPVYLWINNDTAELRDASHLWGREVHPTLEAVRSEVGDGKASMAVIGPGGERLVLFSCIALDGKNFVGRAGLGAVMGSKNLKGVAVNGKTRPEVFDKDEIAGIARWLRDNYKTTLGTMQEMGTARGVIGFNEAGNLPTRNFREGSFEGVETLTGRHMTDTILVDRESCYGCPVRCKRVVQVEEKGLAVGREYGGPEYETIASFGSCCGISDIKVVAKANAVCNANTLDTISAGVMVSGAMECAEKGLLPADLLEGLDLRFGSTQGLLGLLGRIISREGLGDLLADGPGHLEEKIGKEAAECFLHVKGQPLPMHEPRYKTGMGMGFVLSPTGADHIHNIHDNLYKEEKEASFDAVRNMGILDAVDNLVLGPEKARLFTYMMLARSVPNILTICHFMPFHMDNWVQQVRAVTGWNVSNWELIKASERALNMARCFNAREGFTAEQDMLPDRFFQPMEGGTLKGRSLDRKEFTETRDLVYDMLGWDHKTGAPHDWKLHELGLSWIIDGRRL